MANQPPPNVNGIDHPAPYRADRTRQIGGSESLPLEIRVSTLDLSGKYAQPISDGAKKFMLDAQSLVVNRIRHTLDYKMSASVGPAGISTRQTDDELYLPPVFPVRATTNPRWITPLTDKFSRSRVSRDIPSAFVPVAGK